jgi:hypothetical protein
MDGGMKEKDVAARVRRAIKDVTARKRHLRTQEWQSSLGTNTGVAEEGQSLHTTTTSLPLPSISHRADDAVGENSRDERLNLPAGNPESHALARPTSPHCTAFVPSESISRLHRRSHSRSLEYKIINEPSKVSTNTNLIRTNQGYLLSSNDLEEDEESLLMHYLDHIFPLQFRF